MASSVDPAVEEDDDAPREFTGDLQQDDYESEHSKRVAALDAKDPVYQIALRNCLLQAILEFAKQAPPHAFLQLTDNLNDDTKSVVKDCLKR